MANLINWFEIPVKDIQRATKFYADVLETEFSIMEMTNLKMAFFGGDMGESGGSLCEGEEYVPGTQGVLLYFNGGDDLDEPLSRVERAGGKVIIPKTKISDEIGYMAVFIDSEGNRAAFHSRG